MGRAVKEWIGKTDDEAIPLRVKLRVFDRYGSRCAECKLIIRGGLLPTYDHIKALTNGGENREGNLQLLCVPCHKVKTKGDVGEKKISNRVKAKHLGIKKRKGRPMPGSRDSGIKMKIGGGWERR
jgi:5-methylcytosine-specific restriction endonuclease McrA